MGTPNDPTAEPPSEPAAGGPAGRGEAPAPGWYDDPAAPGRPRWWDGQRWAPPAPSPPAMGVLGHAVGTASRPVDLVQEHQAGSRARTLLWVGLAGYLANAVVSVPTLAWFTDEMARMIDAIERGIVYEPTVDASMTALNALSSVVSLAALAAGIVFLVWFHRAMLNARDLGLPQRLSPVWGVLGFILPIINYWFPYWAAADLFPAGHQGRRLVARWWAPWLGAQVLAMVAMVIAFFSIPAAIAVMVVVAALYLLAFVAARSLIPAVLGAHCELAEQRRLVPAGFDPAAEAARTATTAAEVPDPWARAREAGRGAGPWQQP